MQEVAETLKKAGEQLAKAGQQLPAGGESDPLIPEGPSAGSPGESDPMMPEGEAGMEGDPAIDDMQQASAGSEASDPMMPESDPMMQGSDSPGGEGGQWSDAEISEELQAAREALEQAGIALQTAGTTLETAASDEELAAAQEQLARARLAVIVAGQDLLDIRGILDDAQIPDDVLAESEDALNEANVAIVIATDILPQLNLPSLQLPGLPGGPPGGNSELDEELNESIAIFEGKILDARREVIGSSPPPTSAENVPGVAILGGGDSDGDEEGSFGDPASGDSDMIFEEGMEDDSLAAPEIAATENVATPIPEDIPDPQGDDIVAQQLREAAIAEADPELREKLWEEYRRYKASL